MKNIRAFLASLVALSLCLPALASETATQSQSPDSGPEAYYRSAVHRAYEKLGDLAEIGRKTMASRSLNDPVKFESTLPSKEKVLETRDADRFKQYASLAEAYMWAGEKEKAEQIFSWCLKHNDAVLNQEDKYVNGVIGCNLAISYFTGKNYARAEELLKASAKALTERSPRDEDWNYLITDYLLLTLISEQNSKVDEANSWAMKFAAVVASKQTADMKREQEQGEPEVKLDTSPEKVAKYRSIVHMAISKHAEILSKSKDVIKNIIPDAAAYEKTLPSQAKVLETDDALNFKNYGGLAEAYLYEDQVTKAEELFKWCQLHSQKVLGKDDRFINGAVATDFGFYYFVTKSNPARAEELLRLSTKTLEKNPTRREQDSLITAYMILSLICEANKKESDADSFATHFCAVSASKYGGKSKSGE